MKIHKLVVAAIAFTSISAAADYDHLTNVSQGGKSNYSVLNGDKIIRAMKRKDYSQLQYLLNNNIHINSQIKGDGTPLILAVRNADLDMVKTLVEWGADVNGAARGDGNPLIEAAKLNKLSIASFLFEQGAEIDAIVAGDETPLINAARSGHLGMVKYLVENGADVNLGVDVIATEGKVHRRPLNVAKDGNVIEFLVSMGARS